MAEDKDRYSILELLAKLAGYKGLEYEICDFKDGRILSIKNVKIEKVELRNDIT